MMSTKLTVQPPWDLDEQVRKPVTPKTRELADALFTAIISGVHRYGTRLPAERAICEEYGLSRNTVRQALDLLDQYKVITRHAGSGSVVCYRRPEAPVAAEPVIERNAPSLNLSDIGEITSPLELGVVRSIIEPEIARLAVLSMSSRDIQQMNEIQKQIEQVTIDGELYCDLDDKLRMQIARGTHNPLLIVIYQMINHVNQTADWAARRRKALTPRRIKEYQLQSKALCDAINNREIEATVENLKLSLAEFHQDLTKGL